MPNTAVEVEGLSIWELCTTSTMAGAGSWAAGSIWAWLCWVGCTKAVACVCCCTVRMGWAREVCTLGLVERTEPLALPNTGTCSTGPSDCMAGRQTAAQSGSSSIQHGSHSPSQAALKKHIQCFADELMLCTSPAEEPRTLLQVEWSWKRNTPRDAGTMTLCEALPNWLPPTFQGKGSTFEYWGSLYYTKKLTFLSLHLCCWHNCGCGGSGGIGDCGRSHHWTDAGSWSRLIPSYGSSSHFTGSWHNRSWFNVCCWGIWSAGTVKQDIGFIMVQKADFQNNKYILIARNTLF